MVKENQLFKVPQHLGMFEALDRGCDSPFGDPKAVLTQHESTNIFSPRKTDLKLITQQVPLELDSPVQTDPAALHESTGFLTEQVNQPIDLTTSENMQEVWHGEFTRQFQIFKQKYNHQWLLIPTLEPPVEPPRNHWYCTQDTAKVRFTCIDCGNSWTSMKGQVTFWFRIDYLTGHGIVMFKLYGQKCQICEPKFFEHSIWYPEEVTKVINNVASEAGRQIYSIHIDSEFIPAKREVHSRPGKPLRNHNQSECSACLSGLCQSAARSRKHSQLSRE